jgi:ACS family pantothenate transporter-like MFS transporter
MVERKEPVGARDVVVEDFSINTTDQSPRSKWDKVQEIIWDGPRPAEEKRLVQRLDIFLL